MKKTTIVVAASLLSIVTAAALLSQVRVASAAVTPAVAAAPEQVEATVEAPPMSRRERMARIVAEQAAITAEATARQALARRSAEWDSASR